MYSLLLKDVILAGNIINWYQENCSKENCPKENFLERKLHERKLTRNFLLVLCY